MVCYSSLVRAGKVIFFWT